MSKQTTYVMPEPQVRVVDGEFRFTGEAKPVDVKGKVLDYLRAAGVYNSKADVYNGSVYFDDDFSIKERLGEVDKVLAAVDGKRLEKDLNKKGYAFLMAKGKVPKKFRDYKDKGFIANTDRVIQDLVYQKIPKELKLDFGARHFKAQESIKLMLSDKEYKDVMHNYWQPNLEVIQKLDKQPVSCYKLAKGKLDVVTADSEVLRPAEVASVWSYWSGPEARPFAYALRPLYRYDYGVAALKKVTKASE